MEDQVLAQVYKISVSVGLWWLMHRNPWFLILHQ